MGYDTDRFLEEVNDALTCCICRDVLQNPVQASCEHAYCQTCIEGWLVLESTCPEDRRPISLGTLRPLFRYMRNDLNRLRIKCINSSTGCPYVGDLEFIESHECNCPCETVKCPHKRCSVYVKRAELSEHTRLCERRHQECPNGCGLLIIRPEDSEHSCLAELRMSLDVLRSEMALKSEDQKREIDLRLDMQRGHMVQRETTLQSQLDALKAENSQLSQNVKLLMDTELQRRQDMAKLELEKKELLELLRGGVNRSSPVSTQVVAASNSPKNRPLRGKVTTI